MSLASLTVKLFTCQIILVIHHICPFAWPWTKPNTWPHNYPKQSWQIYPLLVHSTQVNRAFGTHWLTSSKVISKYRFYSPLSSWRDKSMLRGLNFVIQAKYKKRLWEILNMIWNMLKTEISLHYNLFSEAQGFPFLSFSYDFSPKGDHISLTFWNCMLSPVLLSWPDIFEIDIPVTVTFDCFFISSHLVSNILFGWRALILPRSKPPAKTSTVIGKFSKNFWLSK